MQGRITSRRQFLGTAGGAAGAAWIGLHWPSIAAAAQHGHDAAAGRTEHEFQVLSTAQARDVEAIAAQIVPSGRTPGAREAGVVYFIDRIHAGIYAAGAADFVAGLKDFQDEFARRRPDAGPFAGLPDEGQLAHLREVEKTPFFESMRFLTVLGLLSLPSYGGNAGQVGWKLVGFVDRHVWEPPFGHYDRDYPGFEPYAGERRS